MIGAGNSFTKDAGSHDPTPVSCHRVKPNYSHSLSEGAAYPRPLNCAGVASNPLCDPSAFSPLHEGGFYAVTGAE